MPQQRNKNFDQTKKKTGIRVSIPSHRPTPGVEKLHFCWPVLPACPWRLR